MSKRLGGIDTVRQMFGGVSRMTINRWERDGLIPRSIKIGVGAGSKRTWDLDECDAAIERRLAQRPE